MRLRPVNANLNWTGRKTITRDMIEVQIDWPAKNGAPTLKKLNVDLERLGLSSNANVAATLWTTVSARRTAIDLGHPPLATLDDEVLLEDLGRTRISLEITVEDSDKKLLAIAKPIPDWPPDPEDPTPEPKPYGSKTRTLVGFQLDENDEMGPDQTFRVDFPTPSFNQTATILVNRRSQVLWKNIHQKPTHAFRKLILEQAIRQIADRVIEEAKQGLFEPALMPTPEGRWNSWMHAKLRDPIPGRKGLNDIDLEDEDEVAEWRDMAIELFLQGYKTPENLEAALNQYGGGY